MTELYLIWYFFASLSIWQPPAFGLHPAYTSLTHWHKSDQPGTHWLLEQYNDAFHLR